MELIVKKLIATHEEDRYIIWYFQPQKIKTERINTHTGYQQIPGIIMGMSKNGRQTRKAIQTGNKCNRSNLYNLQDIWGAN